MRGEIIGFFNEFYEQNKFVRSLNSTFFILVPRVEAMLDIMDFKAISMVGSLYKILA